MDDWLLVIIIVIFILFIVIITCITYKQSTTDINVNTGLHSVSATIKTFSEDVEDLIGNGGVLYSVSGSKITVLPYIPLPNGEGFELRFNSKTNPIIYWVENESEISTSPTTSRFPDPVFNFSTPDYKNPHVTVDLDAGSYFYFKTTSLQDGSVETVLKYKWPVKTYSIRSLPPKEQIMLNASAIDVPLTNLQVPMSFDSRQRWPGAITGALNQLNCGSCWAFATTTCLSDRYRKVYPDNQELRQTVTYTISSGTKYTSMNNVSPYQLVRCTNCTSNHSGPPDKNCQYGCQGGFVPVALKHLINTGGNSISDEEAQVITNESAPCKVNRDKYQGIALGKVSEMVTRNASPDEIQSTILKIKQEIYQNGPVCAAFTVYNDFYDYKRGIYSGGKNGLVGGHAVVIVGWGPDYWIVRNSWGIAWGMDGFFNIKIDWTPPNELDDVGNPNLGILDEIWTLAVG